MQKVKELEYKIRDEIVAISEEIAIQQSAFGKKKKQLEEIIESRRQYQKEAFLSEYGHTVEKIISDYLILFHKCCYQGGSGYDFKVEGYSYHACHWVVNPDKKKICIPTPLVEEAFDIMGYPPIYIADEPHMERWGN